MEPFRFFYREAPLFLREFGIVRKVKKLQLLFLFLYSVSEMDFHVDFTDMMQNLFL